MLSKQAKQRRKTNRAIREFSANKHFRLSVKRHKRLGATFVWDGKFLKIFGKGPNPDDVIMGA